MIDSLNVFRLVAQQASFTKAAELAGLTRPAVSQQIKQLEQRFGVELFTRNTRRVALTPAGDALLVYAERILGAVAEMESSMAALRDHHRTVVTVAASTVPGENLLPRVLAAFRTEYPATEVRVRIANSETVLSWVRDGQADLGLIGRRVSDPWLESEPVAADEIVLALRPGEELPDPLPLDRLRQVPLVLREPGSAVRATVLDALRERSVGLSDLSVVAEVGSPEALKNAVRSGVGNGFLSRLSLAQGELPFIRVESLPLQRSICACWPRHRPPRGVQRALIDKLAAL